MGKITDKLFSFSTEELRLELCIEIDDYDLFLLRKSQILDKLVDIKNMLEKQSKIHKQWDNKNKLNKIYIKSNKLNRLGGKE